MPRLCAALGEASLRLPPQVTAVLAAQRGRPRPGRGGRLIIDRCNPCASLSAPYLHALCCIAGPRPIAPPALVGNDGGFLNPQRCCGCRPLKSGTRTNMLFGRSVRDLRRHCLQVHVRAIWPGGRGRRPPDAHAAQPLYRQCAADHAAACAGSSSRRRRGSCDCSRQGAGALRTGVVQH